LACIAWLDGFMTTSAMPSMREDNKSFYPCRESNPCSSAFLPTAFSMYRLS
jgi:hypothetical protein